MINPFPDLLTFSLLAPFIIRVALGAYFILYSYALAQKIYRKDTLSEGASWKKHMAVLVSLFGGVSVFVGFLTQIGAILLALLSAGFIYSKEGNRAFALFLFAMSLSLLFSGAGAFAFDLPL